MNALEIEYNKERRQRVWEIYKELVKPELGKDDLFWKMKDEEKLHDDMFDRVSVAEKIEECFHLGITTQLLEGIE